MIKIIDGKRYNTETAEKVYCHWNGYGRDDFKHRTKTLYRTAKGSWFLYHYGGAMTDMAVSNGSTTTGSDRIEPVDDEDALGFLEAHSDDREALEAIEKYFADDVVDA